MDTEQKIERSKPGKQLNVAERNVLIAKLIDKLAHGYYSTNQLAKELNLTHEMVARYRVVADEVIGKGKIDRNVIRNLQIRRTYRLIEQLTNDLAETVEPKERSMLYSQIAKFSSHLALITGLNIETQVNVDQQQLVIIRADNNERVKVIENELSKVSDEISVQNQERRSKSHKTKQHEQEV